MVETADATANEWNDPVVTDELLGWGSKGFFAGGFGMLVVTRIAIAITSMVLFMNQFGEAAEAGFEVPGSLKTLVIFTGLDAIASVIFTTGLVVAGLFGLRMPAWARVTMLSVAALVLVGSNAFATAALFNAF